MIKVAAKPQTRSEILQIAQIFEARVVDVTPSSLMLEATGPEERIDRLLLMLRGFGIRELVRTGPVAMMRGSAASVSAKSGNRIERIAEAVAPVNGIAVVAN
jgi:acetolactate synthase-1/3 small subunit